MDGGGGNDAAGQGRDERDGEGSRAQARGGGGSRVHALYPLWEGRRDDFRFIRALIADYRMGLKSPLSQRRRVRVQDTRHS
ncbi:hypothetical protein LYSHEL_31220 [Lysobacter helvus]|uniref:Uncharacterized protein n=2 Tax=Lysobacteraceae TaxID=32033 RepID=A0ABM7Q9Q4_9GAMM|nr:hypothetical protein LYSCAS_31190 [Lysobacter caseinilyticus]BCT97251.1 hypothetical protein LYSHEL_31220 [Lysobacter helvus]